MKNSVTSRSTLINTVVLLLLIIYSTGCKKFIEISTPITSINQNNVYNNDNTAIAVLSAIYTQMSYNPFSDNGITSMSLHPELCADNFRMINTSASMLPYYQNDLTSTIKGGDNTPPSYWTWLYQYIYQTNAALEGVNASNTLTAEVKARLVGEASFIRAFCYFYLVNLYGDVPLVLSTNYKDNSTLPRTSSQEVYQQIITDLKTAQSTLTDAYQDITLLKSTDQRIRPNKGAATALLSRTYLFTGNYTEAEIQASQLIENNPYYELKDLAQVFQMNSEETIWSLQPVSADYNTWEARLFLLPNSGPTLGYPLCLSDGLIADFDNSDNRLNIWIGNVTADGQKYYYAAKYKAGFSVTTVSEYTVVLRLGEQYLVRAEARAMQGKLTGANSASNDINIIRSRAGLAAITIDGKQQMLNEILNERRRELFTEWGHRWFDLKRTGKIDEAMNIACPLKGGTWQPYKALFPISQDEININPGMTGQQNPGY